MEPPDDKEEAVAGAMDCEEREAVVMDEVDVEAAK